MAAFMLGVVFASFLFILPGEMNQENDHEEPQQPAEISAEIKN